MRVKCQDRPERNLFPLELNLVSIYPPRLQAGVINSKTVNLFNSRAVLLPQKNLFVPGVYLLMALESLQLLFLGRRHIKAQLRLSS